MFHVRPEGEVIHQGFNFYPWSERGYRIGFVFALGKLRWWFRLYRSEPVTRIVNMVIRDRGEI